MTTERSTYTYKDGAQETVTLRRNAITPRGHALLLISYSDGRRADCYVDLAWLRDRADQLADTPRPLTHDDITDEARGRAYRAVAALSVSDWDDLSGVAKGRAMALAEAVITEIIRPEPPARPEGAEKVEAVLHQYWSGDINGDDLADRIVEEMNR